MADELKYDLVEQVRAIAARARKRQSDVRPLPQRVEQLPLWPEHVRAVPNSFLRSALFGVIAKGKRHCMEDEKVASLEGVEIRYTGHRLNQGDLDVWASVLHVARLQTMGAQCWITAYALLKLMGKTDTGSNREGLHKHLMRLKASAVEVRLQGLPDYAGSLIDDVWRDRGTYKYVITLNPNLRPLFDAGQFTQVEWAVRHALSGKPLAQWLHGFYASHAKPFPLKVETLHKLSGSGTARVDHFREMLRKALSAVAEASKAHGEEFHSDIRGDLVHVEKGIQGRQQRHSMRRVAMSRTLCT